MISENVIFNNLLKTKHFVFNLENEFVKLNIVILKGQATADIVREFAENHEAWQTNFFNAWEKMQLNGYNSWELTEAPANGHLLSQTEW